MQEWPAGWHADAYRRLLSSDLATARVLKAPHASALGIPPISWWQKGVAGCKKVCCMFEGSHLQQPAGIGFSIMAPSWAGHCRIL